MQQNTGRLTDTSTYLFEHQTLSILYTGKILPTT